MRKIYLKSFFENLFNQFQNNPDSQQEDEWQKHFFESMFNADWVLPDLEQDKPSENTFFNKKTDQDTSKKQDESFRDEPAKDKDQDQKGNDKKEENKNTKQDKNAEQEETADPYYETYKQRGFAIAISSDDQSSGEARLNNLLESLNQQEQADLSQMNATVNKYQQPFIFKKEFYDTLISQVKIRLDDYHGSFDGLITSRKTIEGLKDDVYQKRSAIELEISEQKKDLLQTWIDEASNKIYQILNNNEDLLTNRRTAAQNTYAKDADRNQILIKELTDTRTLFKDTLHHLRHRKDVIAGEGNGRYGAKFLISTGYLLSIAAGLLFSVFTSNLSFGSTDLASFIFSGLSKGAQEIEGSLITKVCQLLGVFGIITIVSLLCRSAIVHIRKRQLVNNEEADEHYLQLKIKNDTLLYSGKFKANNWALFWLKILPILLLAGAVLILTAKNNIEGLSDSMGGLVIGSLIALGLAAFAYVYIMKVIEPRLLKSKQRQLDKNHSRYEKRMNEEEGKNENDNSSGKRTETSDNQNDQKIEWGYIKWFLHWEIIGSFFFFLITTLFIIWHIRYDEHALGLMGTVEKSMISLLWFLSVALLCAFVLGYGTRIKSLDEAEEELMSKKLAYDDLIDQLSGIIRSSGNHQLNHQADVFMQKLMDLVIRRNDTIFRNGKRVYIKESQTSVSGIKNYRLFGNFVNAIRDFFNTIFRVLEQIFFPSELPAPERKYDLNEREVMEEMIKWEEEYFADKYHMLNVYDETLKKHTATLVEIDGKIKQFNSIDTGPVAEMITSLNKSVEEQEYCNRKIVSAEQLVIICSRRIQAKYRLAVDLIKKGYDLGIWYLADDKAFKQ